MALFSRKISSNQIFTGGFFLIILIGALLLMMPLSSEGASKTNFIDALFTSTSSVCVTGLVVKDTGTYWSNFGQFIILLLMQIGGLGFMTLATFGIILSGKKITYSQRFLIKDSVGNNTLHGVVRLSKNIVYYAIITELLGAFLLSFIFIKDYGFFKGVWFSIFHSVAAFCNAGFDLMGNFSSLTKYHRNFIVNFTVMSLIVLGGLGFSSFFEIGEKKKFRKFSVHTKIVLVTTACLIFFPTILILAIEYNNPLTIGNYNFFEKVQAVLFNVISPRTAGFNTIDLASLRSSSKFITMILMFIGGSPGSTAGGIKTTTFALIIIASISIIKEKNKIEIYNRTIPFTTLNKALVFLVMGVFVVSTGSIIISLENPEIPFMNIMYEVISAYATVGLTLGITTKIGIISKIVLIIIMFLGRVGTLTVIYSFIKSEGNKKYYYPKEDINL